MDDRKATVIDTQVGRRVRLRRHELHITQEQLAKTLGLTFQQVQKYERGVNRVSASKLLMIAHALKVPVGYFFEGLEEAGALEPTAEDLAIKTFLETTEGREAVLALIACTVTQREQLTNLARTMGPQQQVAA